MFPNLYIFFRFFGLMLFGIFFLLVAFIRFVFDEFCVFFIPPLTEALIRTNTTISSISLSLCFSFSSAISANEWKRRRKTAIIAFKSRKLQVTNSTWIERGRERENAREIVMAIATAKTRPILINTRQQEAQSFARSREKKKHTQKANFCWMKLQTFMHKLSLVKRLHVYEGEYCTIVEFICIRPNGKKIGRFIVAGIMQYCWTRRRWRRWRGVDRSNFTSCNFYWATTIEYSAWTVGCYN